MITFEISPGFLDDDFYNYVNNIHGKIISYDKEENECQSGEIKATYIDAATIFNKGESLLEILDSYSQKMYEYYEAIFSDKSPVNKFLLNYHNAYDWPCEHKNFLFIDFVSIKKKFRGHKIALAAIYRVIQKFAAGCQFVFMDVSPMQFNAEFYENIAELGVDSFTKNKEEAVEKLKNYYSKIGFVRIPNSNYMFYDCELVKPSLSDIGFDGRVIA
jgi:hypothetical protein